MATKAMLQESKGACNKLKLKYMHWKAKALRCMKQLSFIPWLRDQVWTRGFHWGFEFFKTSVLQPRRWQFLQKPWLLISCLSHRLQLTRWWRSGKNCSLVLKRTTFMAFTLKTPRCHSFLRISRSPLKMKMKLHLPLDCVSCPLCNLVIINEEKLLTFHPLCFPLHNTYGYPPPPIAWVKAKFSQGYKERKIEKTL